MDPLLGFGGKCDSVKWQRCAKLEASFSKSHPAGSAATWEGLDCALLLRPPILPNHRQLSHPKKELLVLGKQPLVDIRPGKLKLNSLHEMKFGLRNVPAAGVNTSSKRINSEAAGGGGRETRAPFYPFKLADLDDKGSCLIPLCASEYSKTLREHAAGKETCKKVPGSRPIWHEVSRKRKENKQTEYKKQNWGTPVSSVQIPTPSRHRRAGGCFPEAPGCKSASAPWSFPGAASKDPMDPPLERTDSTQRNKTRTCRSLAR